MKQDELDLNATAFVLQEPLPEDPMGVAHSLGGLVDREMVSGGVTTPSIYIFRGLHGERWDVAGELPCDLDDIARALAERVDADCVAVVGKVPVPDGVRADKAWAITTENKRGRYLRVLALVEGSTDSDPDLQIYGAHSDDDTRHWIGQKSSVKLDFLEKEQMGIWSTPTAEA